MTLSFFPKNKSCFVTRAQVNRILILHRLTDISGKFRKNTMRYKRIGYNLNVMRQPACLVFNPIAVDGYAALFNCRPVDRASDSMMAPT